VKKLTIIETIVSLVMALIVIIALYNLFFSPIEIKDVYQYIDHDAQVVCYILENGNGISCLPLSEVNISE